MALGQCLDRHTSAPNVNVDQAVSAVCPQMEQVIQCSSMSALENPKAVCQFSRLCRDITGNSFDPTPGFTTCSSTSDCSSKLETYWGSLSIPSSSCCKCMCFVHAGPVAPSPFLSVHCMPTCMHTRMHAGAQIQAFRHAHMLALMHPRMDMFVLQVSATPAKPQTQRGVLPPVAMLVSGPPLAHA